MTFTFRLEQIDGTPADPPQVRFGVFAWKPGDTIAPSAGRSRRVVDVRNTLSKLGCRTRTQAATRAIELRLVEPSPSH